MTSPSFTVLNTLYEQANEGLKLATEKAAKANNTLIEEEEKRDMLRGYRQDYVDNLAKLMAKGLTKETYQNYQNFLRKLDQAITGQEEMVVAAQYQLMIQREIWQEAQRKKMSYEVLLKRAKKKEHIVGLKREQKMMDEYANA